MDGTTFIEKKGVSVTNFPRIRMKLQYTLFFSVKPNAPTTPEVVEIGRDSITLQWSHSNPRLVWSYLVEFRLASEQTFTRLTKIPQPSRPMLSIDGLLSPGTEYGFRVLARNSQGISEPSEEIVVRTLGILTAVSYL